MPLYDYECPECKSAEEGFEKIKDRHNHNCSCGVKMLLITKPANLRPDFPAGMWESFSEDGPIYIGSKQQLKEECKRYGVSSRYLWDG